MPGVRRRALEVRQQAVAAGATPSDLAAGDALAEQARLLAEQDRRADALGRLSEAIAQWNSAASNARARAAATAAPPASLLPPVTTAPAPSDPRPMIEDAIAHADPMVLRGLLYQLTGDPEVMATDVKTVLAGSFDVPAAATEADVALLRRKGAAFLKAYRDSGAGPIGIGPRDRLAVSLGLMLGLLPTMAFLVTVWLAARAGMKLVPMIMLGYSVWAIGALILYLLRNTLGMK